MAGTDWAGEESEGEITEVACSHSCQSLWSWTHTKSGFYSSCDEKSLKDVTVGSDTV